MKIRVHTAVLATAMGIFSLSPASAFWDDTRPPPNGMNGLSLNGLSANGLSANGLSANGASTNGVTVGSAAVKAVILKDGGRVNLP